MHGGCDGTAKRTPELRPTDPRRTVNRRGPRVPWSLEAPAYNLCMVAVLHAAAQTAPHAVGAWLATLAGDYSAEERAAFAAAFEYARTHTGDALMPDGEAALDRAFGTATILAGLKLDADSIR